MRRLPRGIYFEAARDRYRVRLYYNQRVCWLAYYPTLETALEGLHTARRKRLERVRALVHQPPKQLPGKIEDLIR